jgi:hypothetical protein
MKSNICKITNGTSDLDAILNESEKVAVYNELDHKQTLQLRLLCEELDGMLPNIVDDFEGNLWIEFEDGVCRINASIKLPAIDSFQKKDLLGVSKSKKNSAEIGIVGKIRESIENFFSNETLIHSHPVPTGVTYLSTGYFDGMDYSYLWSLEQYRNAIKEENKEESWDELEKSVISSVADDVMVGIKGKTVDIVIVKKFV